MRLLATFLLFAIACFAQPSSSTASHIRWGPALPATCSPNTGDVFFTTASPAVYYCSATNTWTALAASSGAVSSINSTTISGLGAATGSNIAKVVRDGQTLSDCQVGGGSTITVCVDVASGVWKGLPAIPDPSQYLPSHIDSGCGVEYVSGLSFTVAACSYTISGITYTSALTNITLSAADPSNPRIDVIVVDNTGTASAIAGTAAANPSAPTVDPSTTIELTFVYVAAGATTPANFTLTSIYKENTEWTCTASANFNCNSTSNPYKGTKDIEATTAVSGNNVTLVKPAAGTETLSTYTVLIFYIRSKALWPSGTGSGANGLRTLSLWWQNGSTQVGNQVVLRDGQFGFSSGSTSAYQQIFVPLSLFSAGSAPVTTLKYQITGNGGTSSIGFYLDEISLQNQPTVPVPSSLQRVFGITVDGGGSAITTGVKGDTQIPFPCVINYWTVRGDQSGSIVFDIWKLAYATGANPTVANTITASAKPTLSSAINATSAALTGWTTQVTAGDMIRFNVDSASTVTRATLLVGCLQ